MKKHFSRALSALMSFVLCIGLFAVEPPKAQAIYTTMRGLTAQEIVSDMGVGWNLGNSLEAGSSETAWGNPATTKDMIDDIADKGFKTLRIPVRWDTRYTNSSTFTISADFLNRVEEVVNYGLDNDMYVIINIHHNDIQHEFTTNPSDQQAVKNEVSAVWTQVANHFKNYGDKLIFEIINEPRSGEDWTGTTELYSLVNEVNEVGRAAIRATGGNNASRLIMLPTYCASCDTPKMLGWEKNEADDMIAVSIHAYQPFDFAFSGTGHTNWTSDDEKSLKSLFEGMSMLFQDKGIPVVIGEFGSINKNNTDQRLLHAKAFATVAAKYDMPIVWWDNNAFNVGAENFGLYSRWSKSFTYSNIADMLISTYNNYDPAADTDSDEDKFVFSDSESTASGWSQALSIDATIPIRKAIAEGAYFYVEYSGTKDKIELIFQSMSGGEGWAKIPSSESGTLENGKYYVKYSYENCVSGFKSDDFLKYLDKIYVGAAGTDLTVYHFELVVTQNEEDDDNGGGSTIPAVTNTGDVNDSGEIDIRDVVLLYQHISHRAVTINLTKADTNGDGDVSIRDVVLLYQYISNWNVTIK